VVREQRQGTFARPRGQAWGNEAQRAVLHAIAEDVARRSGHRVAAIEVLRADGNLEFVAIAGSPEARDHLLGRATPLAMDRLVSFGTRIDGWVHIPEERVDDETRTWMTEYGHTPELPDSGSSDAWRAQDRLVRLLVNEAGELRATLYLDEPVSGLRPTRESIVAINDEVEVMYDAVVSLVERERFGEQVRMLTQARTAIQSVRRGRGVHDVLGELSAAMVEAMEVDSVDVLLAGELVGDLEPHTAFFAGHMRQVWLDHGHLVVEPTQTWGVSDVAVPTPDTLRRLMDRRGLGSWLLIPIGSGEDYLGTMSLGRRPGGSRWSDSEVLAASAVAVDVAGVIVDARLVEAERRLNAELRDISDYRRDMVLTLAHELRNPVSVLWTHLELLQQDSSPEAVRESRDAMDRSVRRIEDMTEDLMALARVSDPERAITVTPVDLSAVVWEGSTFVAEVAAHAGVDLLTSVAPDQVVVGEETGLQRMVANLLSNAVKYTPAGGRVTVTLQAATDDGRPGVRLTCADTGIGISAADLEHVFTPFFRSGNPEARERPGTGLGLSITERVVKSHRGTIEVTSELGAGTTFVVRLPGAATDDPV
jgi:signal transduction histidine kinase